MRSTAALALFLTACGGCGNGSQHDARGAQMPDEDGYYAAPSTTDRAGPCANVGGSVRACFEESGAAARARSSETCERGVCVSALDDPPVTMPMGVSCVGAGTTQKCRDRRATALPFVCGSDGCVQTAVSLPDDGEWECMDAGGAALCRKISEAAGVAVLREPDRAPWHCGTRGGSERETARELVCVDLDPDTPDGDGAAWRCEYDQHHGLRRTCAHTSEPRLASACERDGECPEGAICASHRCVPPALSVGCWLDTDCGQRRACRFGSCVVVVERGR